MIVLKKSHTVDTRTCDYSSVTKETLLKSSLQHIGDIAQGLEFFRLLLNAAELSHDHDKITDIDGFHNDFVTGFKETTWWERHKTLNRHHLLDKEGVPPDVNLIDVIEMIVDCVMAGMGRSGSVYPLKIEQEVLNAAVQNTINLIKEQIIVEDN